MILLVERSVRRRILHVIAPAPVGGLEQVIRGLAEGAVLRGASVDVAAFVSQPDDDFVRGWKVDGARLHPLVVPGRAYGRARELLAKLIGRLRPDVVHTHGYRCDVIDAPVARRRGIPTVTTVHGFTGGGLRNLLYEQIQLRSLRRFDAVVAVSRALKNRLVRAGVSPSRVHLIPNALGGREPLLPRVEARRALGVGEGFIVGWVGRLSREKGPDVFLEALRHLDDVPLTAAVIGDGPMLAALRDRATRYGLKDRVIWAGRVPDAARYFAAFDAFVLSSRTEGTPITLLEAMHAGVPVIATAVGGVPAVVSAREAVLTPSEQPDAIAAALRDVMRDTAGAEERAHSARARLDSEYRVDTWLDRYDMIYDQVTRGIADPAEASQPDE